MFRKFLIVALTVVAPVLANAQTTDAKSKQIEANERAVYAALQKGDLNAFKAIPADDFVVMDGAGAMPLAEFLKIFSEFKMTKSAIDQVKVSFLSDTAAIITYKWTGAGTVMGQPMPSPVWASTTYVLRTGKWQAVFHQESPATAPPPPAKK